MAGAIIRRTKINPITYYGRNENLWHYPVQTRNILRMALRRRREIARGARTAYKLAKKARNAIVSRNRQRAYYKASRPAKKYRRIVGNAAGTTHTTQRMIVRKTPKEQRFLRKMFRNHNNHQKFVQRFGFSFVGAANNNEAIWYSCTHLKFNNLVSYLRHRASHAGQATGTTANAVDSTTAIGNVPSNFIYLGKCTFNYEIYNPTNYNMTVYIYDLICKNDTPLPIQYGSSQTLGSSCSPEATMQASASSLEYGGTSNKWYVADPTDEEASTAPATTPDWRTVGMKPTDYYYFNTMWKVKGMKKIILPPQAAHHHVVIFNPKKKITVGGLLYPRQVWDKNAKYGVAGLTQSTLFGVEGQVATESDQTSDNEKVGTLPGKIVVKCIRKINTFNFEVNATTIEQKNQLQSLTKPEIFSDLFEVQPESN